MDIHYADDILLLATLEAELQELVDRVKAGHSERIKGWQRFCGFRRQQRKQMSGFLTELE